MTLRDYLLAWQLRLTAEVRQAHFEAEATDVCTDALEEIAAYES